VEAFDLVFADPPYRKGLGERALREVLDQGWIKPGGIAILEEHNDAELEIPQGFEELDKRSYGDTQIVVLRNIPMIRSP
jgi:16S rRNA (guanine966-N2)-methyltransferase